MGLLGLAFRGLAGTARVANSGMIGRSIVGGAIGAGVGYFGSGYNNPNLRGEATAKAAFLGAFGAGLGPSIFKMGVKGIWASRSGLARTGKGLARAGIFAVEHPLLVGGIAAGGMGAAYAANYRPLSGTTMNVNMDQQALAANELTLGTGSITPAFGNPLLPPTYQRLINSTTGLVQGMHRGRH